MKKMQASDMLYATISPALVSVGCHYNATSRRRVGKNSPLCDVTKDKSVRLR